MAEDKEKKAVQVVAALIWREGRFMICPSGSGQLLFDHTQFAAHFCKGLDTFIQMYLFVTG